MADTSTSGWFNLLDLDEDKSIVAPTTVQGSRYSTNSQGLMSSDIRKMQATKADSAPTDVLTTIVNKIIDGFSGDTEDLTDRPVAGRDVANDVYKEYDKLVGVDSNILSSMGQLFMDATDPPAPAPASEDPDRKFYQSSIPIEDRVFKAADEPDLSDLQITDPEGIKDMPPLPKDATEDGGLMTRPRARPESLSDDDMGLPSAAVSEYDFMLPGSKFRTALKDKEAESYQTLFGNAQEKNTPFKGVDITSMSMADVLDLTKSNGEFHKYNKKTFSKNTTAVGKYQFIGSTLRDLKKRGVFTKLGIDDDTLFDEVTQDKLSSYQAIHRLKDRGDGTMSGARKEMRNEWEGFKKVSNKELDGIINEIAGEIGISIGGTKLAPRKSLRPQARP